MVLYCSVPQCKTRWKPNSDIKFHLYPKDDQLKNEWRIRLRTGKAITKTTRVCSKHFSEEDYNITSLGQWKILKRGAVPTQNIPKRQFEQETNQTKKSESSKRRRKILRYWDDLEEDFEVHKSSENLKCRDASSFTGDVSKESVNASTTPSMDSHAEEEILGPSLTSLLDPTSDECEGLPLLGITIKTEPPDEQEVDNPDMSSTCLLEPKIEMTFECEEPDA